MSVNDVDVDERAAFWAGLERLTLNGDAKQLREDARGMAGRFFYDAERGDIGYIAQKCDDKQCDCERKVNADGDQDCSYSLSDFDGEEHICEPIVRMLNALPAALDRIEELERALGESIDIASMSLSHLDRNGEAKANRLLALRALLPAAKEQP